jgi:DNA-binding transcriptional LysR family regulator
MELRHLRYLCAVADRGGFSSASRYLRISQSAISEQIRDLEREIGASIIAREHQKIRFTPHGEIFLREAREILAHMDRAVELTQRSMRGEVGDLSIGFMAAATFRFFPGIIRDFRKRYPGVRLTLLELSPLKQMEALSSGEIDIGFTRDLEPPFDASLRSEMLYTDTIEVVLPQSHPLAGSTVRVDDLAGETFVLYAREAWPGLYDTVIGSCREAGFSPRITNSALIQSIFTLVAAGEGITFLPATLRHYRPHGLVFRRLRPDFPLINLTLAWRDDPHAKAQAAFLDLVRGSKPLIQNAMRVKSRAKAPPAI